MQLRLSKHLFFLLGMYLYRRMVKMISCALSATKPQYAHSQQSASLLKQQHPHVSERY
jgi:hypothetical protein